METFKREIQPVLNEYCYDCHGSGVAKGGVTLDEFSTSAELKDHTLWLRALRNVRSGIMPPVDEPHLPPEHVEKIAQWIKRQVFELDPAVPDPGRVTVRRLNRLEYRNTIRDLIGVEFDTKKEFPADDAGHGFDNIGDVLTVSPMLLEKYLDAAQTIVTAALPEGPTVVAEQTVLGSKFVARVVPSTSTATPVPSAAELRAVAEGAKEEPAPVIKRPAPSVSGSAMELSYYTPAEVTTKYTAKHAGKYQLVLDLRAVERYVENQFDANQCRLIFRANGEKLFERVFAREGSRALSFTFDREWAAGEHELSCEIQPIGEDRPQLRNLRMRLNGVTVRGPMAKEFWVTPKDYGRFFPRAVPPDLAGRRAYAGEILGRFATRAFRRPVDEATVTRLVGLAESVFARPEHTFEAGVAQAMVAVLASPRFIFREESIEPLQAGQKHPFVDEYALASRLSYFFWSTMPDAELFRLAGEHRLRANLPAQLDRLMRDPRAAEFVKNFTGQWLQARDITTVVLDENAIYQREHPPSPVAQASRETFRRIMAIPESKRTPADLAALEEARKARGTRGRTMVPPLSSSLRQAMQEETEMLFAYIVKEDRPLTELLDSNYTFLNEDLAKHYGIEGVSGRAMRKVMLPPDSPRGGVLTQGTILAVTSNPTRTSPVKRGVFILDSILGTPAAPPPPNIPPLEDAVSPEKLKQMTLRENMAAHATNPLCYSCHSRMDPLGLALENFNAMGQWRTAEMNRPIEPAGKLITGETFADIRELKRVLATSRRGDFYHCVSEKLLTYALGRGVEYYDTDTIDQLAAKLEASGGRPSALIRGIVESAPFQQRRLPKAVSTAGITLPTSH